MLLKLPSETPAMKVANRSMAHTGYTVRGIRRRAQGEGVTVWCLRVGKLLFVSLKKFEGAA